MGEEKPDTLDFVKDFQEYLSQQTQHVNMISGSVSGVKEADELPAGNVDISQELNLLMRAHITAMPTPAMTAFKLLPVYPSVRRLQSERAGSPGGGHVPGGRRWDFGGRF